jgi:succinate dehydrogenase/fumarate reductase flavoprotein subunit
MAPHDAGVSRTQVAILGGGIAGAWLGYRLAQRGVETVLIAADVPPVSRRWAAAVMDVRVLDEAAATSLLTDSSGTQDHRLSEHLRTYAAREFEELARLIRLMPFRDWMVPWNPAGVPRLGAGDAVVATVLRRFQELGGTYVAGRGVDLAVEDGVCLGVHYVRDGQAHRLRCRDVVLAPGGYCGLYADGVRADTGGLLGTYARHGGALVNLEFSYRFAFGDLTHGRPLYPDDLDGARLCRADEPAEWLQSARTTLHPARLDLESFTRYWAANRRVPHRAHLADGPVRLGPIRGFSMGGIEAPEGDGPLPNVHAVGEGRHDLVADSIVGIPWLTFLAKGGMLSERLIDTDERPEPAELAVQPVGRPPDAALRTELRRRMDEFQDDRFSEAAARGFTAWCREQRRARADASPEDLDLLILAESCTEAALSRTESRGFFLRGDRPEPDARLAGRRTRATYDADADEVRVELVEPRVPATR